VKIEKTFEEALRIDYSIKSKNALSLNIYGLQTLVNLKLNGWTNKDFSNAFKISEDAVEKIF
jgi:hypothetical protein